MAGYKIELKDKIMHAEAWFDDHKGLQYAPQPIRAFYNLIKRARQIPREAKRYRPDALDRISEIMAYL